MKSAFGNVVVTVVSVLVVPVGLISAGSYENAPYWSLISACVAGATMFWLFCPYVNSLIRQIPSESSEFAFDAEDAEYEDRFSSLADNADVRSCWRREVDAVSLQSLPLGELLPAYRRVLLALFDISDPHFAEELVNDPLSAILWIGNKTKRFSFRRFCKELGR